MSNNQMIDALTILLMVMIGVLFILCVIFVMLRMRSKNPKPKKLEKNNNTVEGNTVAAQSYNKQSIFKFMEFDKIEDNMIVQKDGKRFLMVIECQGINYDLMSGLEKNSVEQGFLQFLNTLRYPIQIYVQTRTVNLSNSINTYKDRVDDISKQYATKQSEYNQKVRSGDYSEQELAKEKYELARQRNLYEYAIDIVNNTERMSLNKNILSKNYYIIIPYYPEEGSNSTFGKDEIMNLAFSELYTKSQALISSLGVCGINSKILDSTEIAELLYVAYNRDESEIFNLRRALNAGYEDLYTTAQDVLDKRMKELDIKIEQEAIKKANQAIYEAIEENQKEKVARQKEEELSDLIDDMAEILIREYDANYGKDITNKAVEKVRKNTKEGGESDGKKAKTTRRKSTKSA